MRMRRPFGTGGARRIAPVGVARILLPVIAGMTIGLPSIATAQTTNTPWVAPIATPILDAMDRGDAPVALKLAQAELRKCEAQARAPVCLNLIGVIGELLTKTGRFAEGEAHARRALAEAERFFGPADEATAYALVELGSALFRQQRYAEAEVAARRAAAVWETVAGIADARTISAIQAESSLLRLLMHRDAEVRFLSDAVQRALAAKAPAYPLAKLRAMLGRTLLAEERIDAAQRELYEAIRLFDLAGQSSAADALDAMLGLASAFMESGEPRNAIPLISAVLDRSDGRPEATREHWDALKIAIEAYRAADMFDAADAAIDRAIMFHERNPALADRLSTDRVMLLIRRGKTAAAERELRRILAGAEFRQMQLPQKQILRALLALVLGMQSKWAEADRALAMIDAEALDYLNRGGLDVQLHRLKAYLALARDQPARARSEFRRAGAALANTPHRAADTKTDLRGDIETYRDLYSGQVKTSWWLANGYRKNEPLALARDWFDWVGSSW